MKAIIKGNEYPLQIESVSGGVIITKPLNITIKAHEDIAIAHERNEG